MTASLKGSLLYPLRTVKVNCRVQDGGPLAVEGVLDARQGSRDMPLRGAIYRLRERVMRGRGIDFIFF